MLANNRSFRKLFAAYGLAAFGDYFDFMAVSILLGFVWKADAMTIALLPLAYAVPGILLGQFAGIAADRRNKRNVMIAADLFRAALTGFLIFAPNPGTLLGLLAVRSAARVFHYPAQQAMTRYVVEPGQLLQATSLNGAVFQFSKVLGPLLGASAAAAFSPSGCLAVNAVCFVLSALLLLRIPASQGRPSAGTAGEDAAADGSGKGGLLGAWREGWRIAAGSRVLLVSVAFSLIGLSGIQLIDAQITVLLRDVSPDRPELLGWLVAAIGAGGLAGIAWLRRYKQLSAYGWLLGGGVVLIGAMFAAIGLIRPDTPLWPMLTAAFVGGIGTGFTSTGMNYILQKETPPEAIGRMSGIFDSLCGVVFVLAPLAGGALVGSLGASSTFLAVGIAVGGVGLLGIAGRRRWRGSAASAGQAAGQAPTERAPSASA